ncbi:BTB/POZ domain-containing protein [Aphelenchoides avenae]|nr:BTB/POZ domain-containing protein [Aphelenchus avenae]
MLAGKAAILFVLTAISLTNSTFTDFIHGKVCGEVHLRKYATMDNVTSEIAKIGGFEWGLRSNYSFYVDTRVFVHWVRPMFGNFEVNAEVTFFVEEAPIDGGLYYKTLNVPYKQSVTFGANKTYIEQRFPSVRYYHDPYLSAEICVLPAAPVLGDFASPSRDRNFALVAGNDTFFINHGYLATLSGTFSRQTHKKYENGNFKNGNISVADSIEGAELQEFLHVIHPSRKPITGENIESLLKVNKFFEIKRMWDDCEEFLWKTVDVPLARRLLLADKYQRESLFNRLLTLMRGKEDVKDAMQTEFSSEAMRKILTTISKFDFSPKWTDVFA